MAGNNLQQRKTASTKQVSADTSAEHANIHKGAVASDRGSRHGWWRIVARIVVTLLGLSVCLSYLITETALWGYQSKWTNWRNFVPRRQQIFSQQELALYDGSNPDLPLLLAVEGDVYDVTAGRGFYGRGSAYNIFVGRDASRAFGTNCLSSKDHLTHDTRGLTEAELGGIKGWHRFFDNHQEYVKVGSVVLDPIDPAAPIPPPCTNAAPKPGSK
ncbi:hypothetical protein H4S06_004941 [Coemansia sp. BCRC 34490]|nr:hypothetical protein LPJ72_001676 [Coemansia sp. Benny D160-2]KAJ2748479.1 hypothetical protein H4S06_004941 [Coemansia sp. BCRC 34490]